MHTPRYFKVCVLAALCLAATTAQPAQASEVSPFPIVATLGSFTGIYGIVTTVGAGAWPTSSKAWQIHAHIAGGFNLSMGIAQLVIARDATSDDTWLTMGVVNTVIGVASVAMAVFNVHKAPALTPMYREEANGERTLGLQLSGSF